MDTSQLLDYLVSAVLGGAGGVAAGIVRVASKLSMYDQRILDLERRLEQTTNKDGEQTRQLEALKQQVEDKLDDLSKEIAESRRESMEHQVEVQRSLGAIEGTLNMIARNGCARACPLPILSAVEPPPSALDYPKIRKP